METTTAKYAKLKDSPEHIFECKEWEMETNNLEVSIKRKINKNNLVELMMENKENWKEISDYIVHIEQKKERS